MINSRLTAQINTLFLAWHLRHIDSKDIADIERTLMKSDRYHLGIRAIYDELRPRVQEIYTNLERCRLPIEYRELKNELVNLCEPTFDAQRRQTYFDSSRLAHESTSAREADEAARATVEERCKRAEILVDLMLACAPYMTVTNQDELQAVVEVITQIHRQKAYDERTVPRILLAFLRSSETQVKVDGQVVAVAVLAQEFRDKSTVNQLLKIARNRSKQYSSDVQKQAVVGLVSLAANDQESCTSEVCATVCQFLRASATSAMFDVNFFLKEELAESLPKMGDRMLQQLVSDLVQPYRVNSSELRKQRTVLDQAIRLFGRQALSTLLITYQRYRNNRNSARPLIMALKMLAMEKLEFLEIPVTINGEQIKLLQSLIDTVESNAPAADLAVQALGQLARHRQVQELLWNKALDDSVRPEIRSSCLWTLCNYGTYFNQGVEQLCNKWASSRIITLGAVATLILFDRGDHAMGDRFAEMLVGRKKAATRLCRAAFATVAPLLRDMLKSTEQRQAAVELLAGLGRQGWDVLGAEYRRTKDPDARIAMLKPFLSIPSHELGRYKQVIENAFTKGTTGERQLAYEIEKRIAVVPA